jgi:hypothetical protein
MSRLIRMLDFCRSPKLLSNGRGEVFTNIQFAWCQLRNSGIPTSK